MESPDAVLAAEFDASSSGVPTVFACLCLSACTPASLPCAPHNNVMHVCKFGCRSKCCASALLRMRDSAHNWRRTGGVLLVARGSSAKPDFERVALPAAGEAAAEVELEPRLVRLLNRYCNLW